MSVHKRVLRVTDEADDKTRAYAETNRIGVYDAATALIMAGLAASEQGAASSWKVELAETVKLSPEDAANVRAFVESSAPTPAPDPRVTAYAEETGATYADALDKLVRLGISRAKALDKHAAGKRAA